MCSYIINLFVKIKTDKLIQQIYTNIYIYIYIKK